jgi:hypothetical protein
MALESFDGICVGKAGVHHHGGPQRDVHGLQAAAVADVPLLAEGETPTAEQFNDLASRFNAVLKALRGVGILPAQ